MSLPFKSCSLRKQPKFRDATTSSPRKSVWNFCAHFLDLILRGKGQWWHHEMLTDFSGYKIGYTIYRCIMQPHTVVFLIFLIFFLSANEGISSYECFKYPWKFVGGSAWNTSLLWSAGIDPFQITFRVFFNIDSCCPQSSLQSFHSDMSSLLRECLHWKSLLWEALGNLWEHENMGINQCIWAVTYFKE